MGRRAGSSNKHSFADTEIEITTETVVTDFWEIRVEATMRPRRLLSSPWRKTATDTADIVLGVDFPEDGSEGRVGIRVARRSSGEVSATYSYERNPWHLGDRKWWQLRTRDRVIRYSTQVEYLGNSYGFSKRLDPSYRDNYSDPSREGTPAITQIVIHLPPGADSSAVPLVVDGKAKLVPDEESGAQVSKLDQPR